MNKNNLLITIKKELRSVFRDKKTIIMILAFPLMIGVLIFLYGFMDTEVIGTESTKYKIGINYEPTEVEKIYLEEMQLEPKIYKRDASVKEAYDNGALGSCFAFSYVKTKSILTPIMFHMIHNTVLVLISIL